LTRAHRQVLLLAGAQALFQTASVMVLAVEGLAGAMLAQSPAAFDYGGTAVGRFGRQRSRGYSAHAGGQCCELAPD
jgi:hypothetical protein